MLVIYILAAPNPNPTANPNAGSNQAFMQQNMPNMMFMQNLGMMGKNYPPKEDKVNLLKFCC